MEGLRGLAVLLVFLVHYESLLEPWIAADASLGVVAGALRIIGNSGVDLFFVLSGYLIYGSLLTRQQSFLHFFTRRLQRIYPAFTAVFALYVALSFLLPSENKIPKDGAALYLLENYLLLPGLLPIQPMITVAWSLSYEMFYYLALPVFMAALKLRDRTVTWRLIFFLSMTVVLAASLGMAGGPIRLLMFVSGIVLHEVMSHSKLRISGSAGLTALLIGLAAMLLPVGGRFGEACQILILFVAFLVFCLACFRTPQAWLPSAFSWTPLRWLGNMSYSYYLLHGLALKGGFMAIGLVLPPTGQQSELHWLLLIPMLLLTLISSAVLFLVIEQPFSLAPRRSRGAVDLPQAASASESGS
ncbi:acyltransferase family protein [Steroidobacter cummioxidans]|uniref:acyltransferase family protein n=1 Tax=Steroidobacter cummioxidans TaxID=1803913 RepID=UPI0019D4C5B0|nr:acyltransferase [Steroidobacter cummioxidans]